MDRYENHREEWREEDAQRKAEKKQAHKEIYDPRDPRYISEDGEENE